MKYDFDTVINRYNTNSAKWDFASQFFKAEGLLPMWVADMDFRVPQEIVDAIKTAADHGIFGYTRVADSYYEALIDWQKRRHGWDIQKDWVVLGNGVVPAIRTLISACTEPGDQVIVQSPVYYPFFNVIQANECEILDNPMRLVNGKYEMDLDDLKAKINKRTKIMLLCSPHNPVARVWRAEELRALGELCLENGILVISDEIHEDIVYEGFQHTPFPLASDKFTDGWMVCTSASKTFNLAGLKTSNTIIPNPDLRQKVSDLVRSYGQAPGFFGPIAAEAAYRCGEPWLEQLLDYLEGNIRLLYEYATDRIPELKVIRPEGTYLVWLDFRGCGINPDKLCTFVREDAKVGTEAGTIFGAKEGGFERMNIACPRSTLEEGLNRLEKTVKSLREF